MPRGTFATTKTSRYVTTTPSSTHPSYDGAR
jgi:hypothetical protein